MYSGGEKNIYFAVSGSKKVKSKFLAAQHFSSTVAQFSPDHPAVGRLSRLGGDGD